MPLTEGAKPSSKEFDKNVATEIKAGKPTKQAVAIAYREAKSDTIGPSPILRAAGILFLAPENQVLFLKRGPGGDYPGFWCLPGGKQEEGESLEECAVREAMEEAGAAPDGKRELLARTLSSGLPAALNEGLPGEAAPGEEVDFTTFLQRISEKFTPIDDDEHVGQAWAPWNEPPQPLHPGVAIALKRLFANELDIARMMVAGELTSPQLYKNVWLVAMRITGTGASYRSAKKEFVWRKPENYLNDEFLARCNGLQVIWEHPEKSTLDSKEFGDRTIGSIFVPYIKGDEVWGIAKVYDAAAAALLSNKQLSTSPTVVVGNPEDPDVKLKHEDGQTILIEGKPVLLDHVAVCEAGVWDKGGKPTGVLTETIFGDSNMTEEEKKAAADAQARKDAEEKAKADAEAKAKADAEGDFKKMMADGMASMADGMKDIKERMDSIDKKADKACADAEEAKSKADGARRADETEEQAKERADKARKDAEEKEAKDKADAEEKAEKEKADALAKADAAAGISDIRKAVADMAAKMAPRTPEDKVKFADAQARADGAYIMLGRQAPAPMDGEILPDYRRRLATGLKVHSTAWKAVDLHTLADSAFEPIEEQIFADAVGYAKRPGEDGTQQLRMVSRNSGSGHVINEFYGPAKSWMDDFAGNRQQARGNFKTNLGGAR